MEQLPVFKYGCDSSYSWSKRYAHLAHKETASQICDRLTALLTNPFNAQGTFVHARSQQATHLAFTGGEPMMSQTAIVDVLGEFENRNNVPPQITVETNGTQALRKPLDAVIRNTYGTNSGREWFWSCSPKLSTSGERWEHAIRPEIVAGYHQASPHGQLKFVVDGTDQVWDQVDAAVDLYRAQGVDWLITVMPVGARKQEQQSIQAQICEAAFDRGYHFSTRVHCFVFDNVIGK